MLRYFTAVAAAGTITFSTVAFGQATAQEVAPPIEVKAKKVCKTESVPGSRLGGKRTCHTPAEWEAIRLRERQMVETYQRDPCRGGAASTGGAIQC